MAVHKVVVPNMSDIPTVAIITRTKNRALLLERAVRSVLGQSFQHWRHVIVNDGGNADEVDALLERHSVAYKGRLTVLHHAESLGMEAASNRGMAESASRYAVIHDDDDSWDPAFLEKTVAFLESPPAASFRGVATWTSVVMESLTDGTVRELSREPFNQWMPHVSLFRMMENNTLPPICFLFRRDVYDEIGGFNESLPVLGDWEFHLRYNLKHDIGLLRETLAFYHHRPPSETGDYGNTVRAQSEKHQFYDNFLRNKWLREDIESGRIGLGFWTNIGLAKNSFDLRLTDTLERVRKLKPRGLFRFLRKR